MRLTCNDDPEEGFRVAERAWRDGFPVWHGGDRRGTLEIRSDFSFPCRALFNRCQREWLRLTVIVLRVPFAFIEAPQLVVCSRHQHNDVVFFVKTGTIV